MAWGARQEHGVWRLCERRGRTIEVVTHQLTPEVEIRFPGRAMAEQCAAVLNDTYWAGYDRSAKSHPQGWSMLAIIYEHKGITPADYERLQR